MVERAREQGMAAPAWRHLPSQPQDDQLKSLLWLRYEPTPQRAVPDLLYQITTKITPRSGKDKVVPQQRFIYN